MTDDEPLQLRDFVAETIKQVIDGCANLPEFVLKHLRKEPSPSLKLYWQALQKHDDEKAAAAAAEAAARKAAHEAEPRKRSYWILLDGYEFERATAEVLNKHQFNAWVTPGQVMVAWISK